MGIICSHIGFRGKRIFCVTCVKKTKKKCSVNSDVEASKFVFFTWDTKSATFFRKFVCQHKMSRYTWEILFHIFENFNLSFHVMGSYVV
jgi:hypothetical protein